MSRSFVDRQPTGAQRIPLLAVCCLMLTAAVFQPTLRAADKPANVHSENVANQQSPTFDLSVVGPNGKAVPEITVEIHGEPPVTAKQIREGRFLRPGKNGIFVRSTTNGRIVLELPANPTQFDVLIETPGYAPYWARWDSENYSEPVPSTFTAELGAAWSVGGVVVDRDGKPVEGARITPRIHYKLRPDDFRGSNFGSHVTTDAAGRWQFDSVPASLKDVIVLVDRADFAPRDFLATRREFGLDRGRNPSAPIVLGRGLTVMGKVTDEAGKSIAGALVRTRLHNTIRKAVTGPDGLYRLRGCDLGQTPFVVSAKGRAMDRREVQVQPGMPSADFRMKPAQTLRIRVVDEQGKPIPRFRLLFQSWLGWTAFFEFDELNSQADDKGVWEWREAGLDPLVVDIICPGHASLVSLVLAARKEEYVFQAAPALIVSGRVVDSQTRQPVRRFLLEWGSPLPHSANYRDFTHAANFATADGHYRLRADYADLDLACVIRIEADGYEPAVSRAIPRNEGNVTIDFEMTQGPNFEATVLTPDGQPAAHAKVMAIFGWHPTLYATNGEIDAQPWELSETDAGGRIHLPPQGRNFDVLITHASGYVHYHSQSRSNHRVIVLDPWTRVEGTYRVDGQPLPGIPIEIDDSSSWSSDQPVGALIIVQSHHTTTGPDGRFVFERVMAGSGQVGRVGGVVNWLPGGVWVVRSTAKIRATFPLGKTAQADVFEKGRPVTGTLRPAAGLKQKVPWQSAVVELETNGGVPNPHFKATVGADGSFRTDPLPGGMYSLDVRFLTPGPGHVFDHPVILYTRDNDKEVTEPLDLGVLTLDKN